MEGEAEAGFLLVSIMDRLSLSQDISLDYYLEVF